MDNKIENLLTRNLLEVFGEPDAGKRRSAIAALIAFIDVPIVYFSVIWWKSLHQAPTVADPLTGKTYIHGSMAWTLLLGFVAFSLLYVFLVAHRRRRLAECHRPPSSAKSVL